MNDKLKKLLAGSKVLDINLADSYLSDLGFIIERCQMQRHHQDDQYQVLLSDVSLLNLEINDEDINGALYFLFFLLLNFPDRAERVAWCLGKFYRPDILVGICQGINLYIHQADLVVFNLVKAITDTVEYDDLPMQCLDVLKNVYYQGGPASKELVIQTFAFYQKHYNFAI